MQLRQAYGIKDRGDLTVHQVDRETRVPTISVSQPRRIARRALWSAANGLKTHKNKCRSPSIAIIEVV